MQAANRVEAALAQCPIVAILRGIEPEEAVDIGEAILDAGITAIEVPLNSPQPIVSIRNLAIALGDRAVIGAGTVLTADAAQEVADSGGIIAVAPNTDMSVIETCIESGMVPMPGFQTPSEAFAALAAGARYLKLFPAGPLGPDHLKALLAVLPTEARVLAVGGAGAANASDWFAAGAAGLGVGSELYRAGDDARRVGKNARQLVAALQN